MSQQYVTPLCLIVFIIVFLHSECKEVNVSSGAELAKAFRDSSVTRITLTRDVKMKKEEWSGYTLQKPYLLNRNITIDSDPTQLHKTWDFNFVQKVVRVAPGTNMSIIHVIMKNTRYGAGADMDLFLNSPGSIWYYGDSVKLQLSCTNFSLASILSMNRSVYAPGTQVVHVLDNFTLPFPGAPTWHRVIHYEDFSTEVPNIEGSFLPESVDKVPEGGYHSVKSDGYKACERYIDEQKCLSQKKTLNQCVLEDIHLMMGSKKKSQTPVIIGAVVAGGVVLFVAGVASFCYQRRRRRLMKSRAGSQNLMKVVIQSDDGMCQLSSLGSAPCPLNPANSMDFPPVIRGTISKEEALTIELGLLLGCGSYGKVFRGRWKDQLLAIKVIHHERGIAEKVSNEVTLMQSFKHPNVVQALGYVTWGSSGVSRATANQEVGSVSARSSLSSATSSSSKDAGLETWILQEYCDCDTLNGAVMRQHYIQEEIIQMRPILTHLLDVARGMQYLHECNVCHGDLKACNVLLTNVQDENGESQIVAKVSDFGLSRALTDGQSHLSTHTMGTVTHMPPELMRSGKLAKSGDVYAFAIVMWEMVTGQVPFKGMMMGEVINKVVVDNERPPFPGFVPREFVELAEVCWDKDPQVRPTFEEVVAKLEELLTLADQLQADLHNAWSKTSGYLE